MNNDIEVFLEKDVKYRKERTSLQWSTDERLPYMRVDMLPSPDQSGMQLGISRPINVSIVLV
jgi:hypothetical protein